MTHELTDSIESLVALMREETERLLSPGPVGNLEEVAAAKARLVGWIEARTTQLGREQPDWLDRLEPEERQALNEVMGELRDVSAANANALERQIQLSVEMLEAITAEARRLSGTRTEIYCPRGGVSRIQGATPISINAQL
jgi:flagellar biosynthesis/type III secretory pathway chaperone